MENYFLKCISENGLTSQGIEKRQSKHSTVIITSLSVYSNWDITLCSILKTELQVLRSLPPNYAWATRKARGRWNHCMSLWRTRFDQLLSWTELSLWKLGMNIIRFCFRSFFFFLFKVRKHWLSNRNKGQGSEQFMVEYRRIPGAFIL